MKMYILIKDSIPFGFALVSAAHASLATYLKFKDSQEMADWLKFSFRKVVCQVTDEQFEKAKEYEDYVILTESALSGQEVSIAFKPREDWPDFFKTLKLYMKK